MSGFLICRGLGTIGGDLGGSRCGSSWHGPGGDGPDPIVKEAIDAGLALAEDRWKLFHLPLRFPLSDCEPGLH